jgi:glucokinase
MNVLAADIGGTNARFAIGEPDAEAVLRVLAARTYPSRTLAGPLEGVRRFLNETGVSVDHVAVGMAGPVRDGVGTMTNRPWAVAANEIAEAAGTGGATLVNDFVALGHALPHLRDADRVELQRGRDDPDGVIAVLGAGTGLGQAFLVRNPSHALPLVRASQGGHGDFAPRSELEWELRSFLGRRADHVSWEHVLSGNGLCAVYDFLVESGRVREDPGTRRAMEIAEATHVIAGRGLAATDRACVAALDLFARLYGSRAGAVALALGATGGVYLGGGIARHVLPALRSGGFVEAFRDKGRMHEWLAAIPVHVVARSDAGLMGALILGIRRAAPHDHATPAEARP